MPRCQYGNCTKTKIAITVNDKDSHERPAFCCREHAALYLLRRAWQYEGPQARSCADQIAATVDAAASLIGETRAAVLSQMMARLAEIAARKVRSVRSDEKV
jgi:hypothetical protein